MEAGKKDSFGFTMAAIGLLIGFFMGAGIVYHLTSMDEKITTAEKTWMKIASIFQPDKEQIPDQLAEESQTEITPVSPGQTLPVEKPAATDAAPQPRYDSVRSETPNLPIEGTLDSTILFSYNDITDSDITLESGHIRISPNRLTGVRAYYLYESENRHETNESTKVLDSLIGGGNQPGFGQRHVFYVEFWKSQINYLSYVMNRNRLIVYGIDQTDMVRILEFDNNIYLKYDEQYYFLELTNTFKVMIPESDPDQIRKLESL